MGSVEMLLAAGIFGLTAGAAFYGLLAWERRHRHRKPSTPQPAEYESLAEELRLALDVQRRWQPPIDLQLGAYRITGRNRHARELGGDLFDAAFVDDTTVAVLIGDVSGKGLPAGIMVPAIHVLFRSELRRGGSAAEILARINRLLCETAPETGVTCGIGLLSAATGELSYASAGHPSPYLQKDGSSPILLDCSSLPLGIDPDAEYEESVVRLAAGERLMLYTDGIIEAFDQRGEMYGFDRLEADLREWPNEQPAAAWMEGLFQRLEQQFDKHKDDRTLLTVERLSAAGRPIAVHERTWRIASVPGCEKVLLQELAPMIDDAWPDAGRKDDMLTCIAEAVMNAAEHGNRYRPDRQVVVHVHFGSMLMVCRVWDEGAGFDVRPASPGERREETAGEHGPARGWGLQLIDGLTDHWLTTRTEQGFGLELFFLAEYRNH